MLLKPPEDIVNQNFAVGTAQLNIFYLKVSFPLILYCTIVVMMYCTITLFILHLQLFYVFKVIERPNLVVGTGQWYIFTEGGHLHPYFPLLCSNHIYVHTLLYLAHIPTLPSRRKKGVFSSTYSFCQAIQEAGWTYHSSPNYIHIFSVSHIMK